MNTIKRCQPLLGTFVEITLTGKAAEERLHQHAGKAFEMIRCVQRMMSFHDPDSDISRWAAGEEVAPEAITDIEHVLRECGRLHADSDGVFRARDPRTGALDTAGYVKGYAIGRAADELRRHGVASFCAGVGGDAAFAGRPAPDRPWQVAVQDPGRRFGVVAVVPVTDGALATSGTTERGDHIWGRAANRALASFTVVGPDIAEADAFATIGFAMGEEGISWVARHEGYRSVVVRADGSLVADAGLVSVA